MFADADDVDHCTFRVAMEELPDDDRIEPAAVLWRQNWVGGDDLSLSGSFS